MHIVVLEWKDLVKFNIYHRHYQWFVTCPHQYLQGDSGFQLLYHQLVAKETGEGTKKKKIPPWHSISRQSRHPWKKFQQSYEESWDRLLIINSKPSPLRLGYAVCKISFFPSFSVYQGIYFRYQNSKSAFLEGGRGKGQKESRERIGVKMGDSEVVKIYNTRQVSCKS